MLRKPDVNSMAEESTTVLPSTPATKNESKSTRCFLLELPPETRQNIYSNSRGQWQSGLGYTSSGNGKFRLRLLHADDGLNLDLSSTCKFIRAEFMDFFWKRFTLRWKYTQNTSYTVLHGYTFTIRSFPALCENIRSLIVYTNFVGKDSANFPNWSSQNPARRIRCTIDGLRDDMGSMHRLDTLTIVHSRRYDIHSRKEECESDHHEKYRLWSGEDWVDYCTDDSNGFERFEKELSGRWLGPLLTDLMQSPCIQAEASAMRTGPNSVTLTPVTEEDLVGVLGKHLLALPFKVEFELRRHMYAMFFDKKLGTLVSKVSLPSFKITSTTRY